MKKIRSQFPILKKKINGKTLIYFDNAATTQKPLSVIDAVSRYYKEENANVHRAAHRLAHEATELYEQAREKTRQFINAGEKSEIIFTSGTTDSINLVAQTLGRISVQSGDEIIISEMEHHSNIVPWQLMAQDRDARIRVIPVTAAGELDIEEFSKLLCEKTKLVAITHVSNTLGTVNPVKEITAIAHSRGVPVLIDGAQAVAHLHVDVQDIGCDFYAFSGHKMYGPTGIGVLYGKRLWLEKLPPYRGGGEMIDTVTFEKTTYNQIPYKFEAGTPNIAGAIGLSAAINFMQPLHAAGSAAYEKELLVYATQKLEEIDGIRIVGTAAEKIGIISFVVAGIHPSDIGVILDQQGIAVRTGVHCTEPLISKLGINGTVRFSFAVYNTKSEVDSAIKALRQAITMLR